MSTYLVQRDNVLVPITDIFWVSKNVFMVTVPLYKKQISCELTAVDVPRGTAPVLENIVAAALERVRCAPHKYLRQDLYSTFPLQGYGDVIFFEGENAERWASLQETLLMHGVGRIVRPVIARLEDLIAAGKEGSSPQNGVQGNAIKSCDWAYNLSELETRRCFCKKLTGRVVDVMRGDVYRICWDDDSDTVSNKSENSHPDEYPLPSLVILQAVTCFSYRTALGYKALRWAQRNLMHSRVEVCLHSMHPSERDVANITQLYSYEQLRHVRASVYVLSGAHDTCKRSVGDALVSKGLGLVRQIVDAALPHSADFYDLLKCAKTRCNGVASETMAAGTTTSSLEERMHCDPSMSSDDVKCLVDFLGPEWCSGFPSLLTLWQTTMWDGDIHRSTHDCSPRVHSARPMRFFWDMEVLPREGVVFGGYIKSLALVRESHRARDTERRQQRRIFLRMEMNAVFSDTLIQNVRSRIQANVLGFISFYPPDNIIFGPHAKVTVLYDRWLSAVSFTETVSLSVSFTKYSPLEFDPQKHRPARAEQTVQLEEGEARRSIAIDLRLGDCEEALYVVDAWVEFSDRNANLRRSGNYLLFKGSNSIDVAGEALYNSEEDDFDDAKKQGNDIMSDDDNEGGEGVEGAEDGGESNANVANLDHLTRSKEQANASIEFFHSSVDFYFEVDAEMVLQGGRPTRLIEEWGEKLRYHDVRCLPVGIGVVNGHRGYVGDVLLVSEAGEEENEGVAAAAGGGGEGGGFRSLLVEIQEKWRLPPMSGSFEASDDSWTDIPLMVRERDQRLCQAMIRRETKNRMLLVTELCEILDNISEEMCEAKVFVTGFMNALSEYSALIEGNTAFLPDHNNNKNNNNDDVVFCVTAGDPTFWYYAGEQCSPEGERTVNTDGSLQTVSFNDRCAANGLLSPSFLPPHVPLFTFSIFPRQIFAAHHAGHRSHVEKKFHVKNHGESKYLHVDWAFFRLLRPSLPYLFASNFERLPMSLRNVERAFCDSLLRGEVSHHKNSSEAVYYATENAFAAILSALFMLQPKGTDKKKGSAHQVRTDPTARQLFQESCGEFYNIDTAPVLHNVVLYRVYPEPGVEGCGHERGKEQRPIFFLGSRATSTSDAFEVPRCYYPLSGSALARAVSVLGFESLVAPHPEKHAADETGDDADVISLVDVGDGDCHPLASRGVGPRPLMHSTPRLYRPFPWLAVLGQPLLARDEYSPKSLGKPSVDAQEKEIVRRHIAVSYVPMGLKKSKPYSSVAYGQFPRNRIYRLVMNRAAAGAEVKDYISLLLLGSACDDADSESRRFADGVLYLYGTANEPLYLFYMTRRQLRFRLSLLWPSILNDASDTEDSEADEAKLGEKLLKQLSEAGRRIIDMVAETTDQPLNSNDVHRKPPMRVYLHFRLDFNDSPRAKNIMRVGIFPVTEEMDENQHESTPKNPANPYQSFDLVGNVYGRRPLRVLVVSYSAENGEYNFEWDEDWELSATAANEPS